MLNLLLFFFFFFSLHERISCGTRNERKSCSSQLVSQRPTNNEWKKNDQRTNADAKRFTQSQWMVWSKVMCTYADDRRRLTQQHIESGESNEKYRCTR